MRLRDHLIAAFIAAHVVIVSLSPVPEAPGEGAVAGAWNAVRGVLQDVGFAYGQAVGTHQWWSMFSGLNPKMKRLEIQVQIDGEWHDVYIHGTDADWSAAAFEQDRWREMFLNLQARRYRPVNTNFLELIAEPLFARHPRATRVRMRTTVARVPPASERRDWEWDFSEVLWRRGLPRERPQRGPR